MILTTTSLTLFSSYGNKLIAPNFVFMLDIQKPCLQQTTNPRIHAIINVNRFNYICFFPEKIIFTTLLSYYCTYELHEATNKVNREIS